MKKIKLLKASYIYPMYLQKIYFENIDLAIMPYQEQYNWVISDFFGWGDVWKRSLESMNSFEVFEVMLTNEIIQRKWANENSIIFDEKNWLLSILDHQIEFFQPDIFFVHDNIYLTSEVVAQIKSKHKSIKFIIGYDGIALNNFERFKGFDLVLSCLESTADFYTKMSYNSVKGYYFPLGFDMEVNSKIGENNPTIPFSFIGSLVRGEGYHNQRIRDITKLVNNTKLEIYSSGLGEPYEAYRYLQRNRLKKFQFEEFWQVYSIGKKVKPAVYGIEMYRLLANSKITFNSHLDNANGKAANMRLFETTGVGSCLITDYTDNLKDFFDIDNEVVTYKSIPECIDKVNNLLKDEKLRIRIASAGKKRTLKDHTLQQRISDLFNYLNLSF